VLSVAAVSSEQGYVPAAGSFVVRATQALRPHPAYERLCAATIAVRVRRVSLQPGPVREPLLTTTGGTILDGYARWRVAVNREQPMLPCIEHQLSDEDALRAVLRHHMGSAGLNDFCRILLALDLEPALRASSNLTSLKRRDVRPDIALAACVSTGNVTKVKQLLETAIPEVREALIRGELRIHRAWEWRRLSNKAQLDSLWNHQQRRGIDQTIGRLVRSHVKDAQSGPPEMPDVNETIARILGLHDVTGLITAVLDVPGKAVVVTRALYDEVCRKEIG
jgi:hypothetical protein